MITYLNCFHSNTAPCAVEHQSLYRLLSLLRQNGSVKDCRFLEKHSDGFIAFNFVTSSLTQESAPVDEMENTRPMSTVSTNLARFEKAKAEAAKLRESEPFRSFSELAAQYQEGLDYDRIIISRESPFAIVAPHAGTIEFGTSTIAEMLAGENLSLYVFRAFAQQSLHPMHITSTRFDDPACEDIVESAEKVITVHGCRDAQADIFVGGRDRFLQKRLLSALNAAGIIAKEDRLFPGKERLNLCNRGRSKTGIQLEFTSRLRNDLFEAPSSFSTPEQKKLLRAIRTIREVLFTESQ